MAPSLPTDAEADRVLGEVLAGPPFTTGGPFDETLRWLLTAWEALVGRFEVLLERAPGLYWLTLVGLLLLAAALVAHLIAVAWSVARALRTPGSTADAARGEAAPGLDLAAARAALAAGDHRAAVELAWTATVAVWRAQAPAELQTPRRLARWLAHAVGPTRAPDVEALVAAHERACYAGEPPDARLARDALARAERLAEHG